MAVSTGRSLTLRLVLTSAVWIAAALIAAGFLLLFLFSGYIERRFDASLRSTMAELIASVDIQSDGNVEFSRLLSNPQFRRPLSGWYWQIAANGELRHQSLSNDQLRRAFMAENTAPGGDEHWVEFVGPKDRGQRALIRSIRLPEAEYSFEFLVAGPRQNIETDVRQFGRQMFLMMGVLALGSVNSRGFSGSFRSSADSNIERQYCKDSKR